MKSISQNGRLINAPLMLRISDAPCPQNPAVPFQVDSQTTLMGNRSHTVTTAERELAYALYEQALEVDIEPDFAQSKGLWTIGFICNDSERDNALNLVLEVVSC